MPITDVTDIGPSTVETVGAVMESTRYPFQRKGFYAQGFHWAFYYASDKIYWRKSADGETWSSPAIDITPSGQTPTDGAEIAIWLDRDAQRVHIVYADHDTDSILYYRRGAVAEDGTLSWDADWQPAVDLVAGVNYRNLTICVDDANGYPFIGYTETLRADPSSDSKPKVTHCRTGTGTWSTFAGFPDIMNATNDESWVCVVVPYHSIYIMAVYARDSNDIKYAVYNITGDSWGAGEVDTGKTIGADATKISVTSQRPGKNTTTDPKQVHVAYCDDSDDLQHIRIEESGVTGPTLIYNSNAPMGPSISTRIYGGHVNPPRTLYVFWTTVSAEPTAHWVCYKKSIDGGTSWTKEDGSDGVELWMNESGAGLPGTNIASSYFEEQHYPLEPEGYIGLLYTNEGASPDYVRWAGLEFTGLDQVLLCHAVIRHVGYPEQLPGGATIRHVGTPVELFGKIPWLALPKVELLGRFDVGQNAEDLPAHAEIENIDYADLPANAIIRHVGTPAELFGKFTVRHTATPAELFGKCVIRHVGTPAELFGKCVIRHVGTPVELLGEADIRKSGSAEFICHAEVRQSAFIEEKLFGRFRTTTDDWAIQGVSVEAYIARSIVQ